MKSDNKTASTTEAPSAVAAAKKSKSAAAKKQARTEVAAGGKLGKVVALLRRPKGATIAELVKTTGWQSHSVRGAISGAIKKKLKLSVLSEKVGAVRTYRIKV